MSTKNLKFRTISSLPRFLMQLFACLVIVSLRQSQRGFKTIYSSKNCIRYPRAKGHIHIHYIHIHKTHKDVHYISI
jgi:hypothetical protein